MALLLIKMAVLHKPMPDGASIVTSFSFIPWDTQGTGVPRPIYDLGWTLNYEMFFYTVFALCIGLRREIAVASIAFCLSALVLFGLLFPCTIRSSSSGRNRSCRIRPRDGIGLAGEAWDNPAPAHTLRAYRGGDRRLLSRFPQHGFTVASLADAERFPARYRVGHSGSDDCGGLRAEEKRTS